MTYQDFMALPEKDKVVILTKVFGLANAMQRANVKRLPNNIREVLEKPVVINFTENGVPGLRGGTLEKECLDNLFHQLESILIGGLPKHLKAEIVFKDYIDKGGDLGKRSEWALGFNQCLDECITVIRDLLQ